MTRINLITTMQGRRDLCHITFGYYARCPFIERLVIVASDPEDLAIAAEYGTAIEYPNDVHGDKFDAGLEAATSDADAVMLTNSGGVISEAYATYVQTRLQRGDPWVSSKSLHVFHGDGVDYIPKTLYNGHGMTIARSLWEDVGLRWKGGAVAGHTDSRMVKGFAEYGYRQHQCWSLPLMTIKVPRFTNITSLETLRRVGGSEPVGDHWQWISDNFDSTLAEELTLLT